MIEPRPGDAKKIIQHLKAGTTPLDCVNFLNVGNNRWYNAVSELFLDIEKDRDSLVRFINGYYGDGKTHFLGMLRSIALDMNWAVSYVTSENTPLNKFHLVLSEIVKNIMIPTEFPIIRWITHEVPKGAFGLLLAYFSRIYIDVHGSKDSAGSMSMRVLQEIREKVSEFIAITGMDEMAGSAVRGFVNAAMSSDLEKLRAIASWLECSNIRIHELGITRMINQASARDIMRAISIISKEAGCGGILILLDEAERIMEQSKLVRKKSYGVIRDLLDNADNQGGMQSCMMYIAATPDMFKSEKGFAEYDALRSRLSNAQRFNMPNFIDWRGVIVDLTKTPLSSDFLIKLGQRIRFIHSIGWDWEAEKCIDDDLIKNIVNEIEKGTFLVSKPRMLTSAIATILEIAEQNPKSDIQEFISPLLESVHSKLSSKPETEQWV
jgi:BREX system ATP-binding protein BrxC/D